jgi:CBS domain-containing protein
MRVQDVMTTDVTTVTRDTPLKEAAQVLLDRGISGVPVVEGGAVVGVLSEADLLALERGDRGERRHGHVLLRARERRHDVRRGPASTVGELMTSPAVTVMPIWTLASAAALMIDKGVNRPPVVRSGELVGIVTRADVIRAFARSDEAVGEELRDAVRFHQGLVLDDSPVTVSVTDGHAVLAGTIRSRSQADRLARVAAGVPGVIAVESELAWTEDDRAAL